MIYGKVLEAMDTNEIHNYATLRNELISKLSSERYFLSKMIEKQNEIIAAYGERFNQEQLIQANYRRVLEFEKDMEKKYESVIAADMKVYSDKCTSGPRSND